MRGIEEKLDVERKLIDKFQSRVNSLLKEHARLESELECFGFDGYEKYQSGFLEKERIRIACESMEILEPDDSRSKLLAQGQYNQVMRQLTRKEDLRTALKNVDADLAYNRKALDKALQRYERIRNAS